MSEKHGSRWLEREDFGNVTVVRLKTPKVLDEDAIRAAFDPILTISGLGRNRLVLNLAAAEHLPSTAVGKLAMLNRKVQASGGRLALCQLTPAVQGILEAAHLNDLFAVYATEQEALRSFS
jgi:anti-anti-sigma factor